MIVPRFYPNETIVAVGARARLSVACARTSRAIDLHDWHSMMGETRVLSWSSPNPSSLARTAVSANRRACRSTHVSTFMNAPTATDCYGRSQAIAACSAPTGPLCVRRCKGVIAAKGVGKRRTRPWRRKRGRTELAADLLLDRKVLHSLLELFEGAHFDLPHALAGNAVFLGEILERRGIVFQPALHEDLALARI